VLYSTLTDSAISRLIAAKYANCDRGASNEPKVKMSLEKMVKLFRKGDGTCYYSGEEFSDVHDVTFERLDPLLDYTESNVVFVRKEYNNAKSFVDKFLRLNKIPDAVKIAILKKCIMVLQRRMNNKLQQDALRVVKESQRQAAEAGRAFRLAEQARVMKRGRFNGVSKPGTGD